MLRLILRPVSMLNTTRTMYPRSFTKFSYPLKAPAYLTTTRINTSLSTKFTQHFSTLREENEDQDDATSFKPRKPKIDFNMVGGYTNVLEGLSDVVLYLQDPEEFTRNGAKPPRGILLYGPPGLEKHLLLKLLQDKREFL